MRSLFSHTQTDRNISNTEARDHFIKVFFSIKSGIKTRFIDKIERKQISIVVF